ncbi:MAG: 16S rRNA (cytosine(967)-C(5))-methyltransferase RsmB [Candidatus Abyssobacteria bacterium SURF_17]|uniref:16S rRNA (cytosine(967)-C(5))-methyltransferase n=1 Tax=Candidatus Abyssobacteria bacterium SURF_17 TaxID=2093361 RepID=A0A419EP14_9BACT|nr:MAG: 16S rRNA (cytosine(967)-C(5))-methyltransferase RsmB [Candidatus Abyssubacteria bacterium SURF_17]
MPRQKVDPSREQALKILRRTETSLSFPKLLLECPDERTDEAVRDRAFTYQLVMGTLRHRGTIDWALGRLYDHSLDDLTPWIRNILRMGLFQILFLDRVPQSAAVDESVKLAKKYGHAGTAGLVNAVLRNAKREALLTDIDSLAEDCVENIAAKYSHPQWLVELLLDDFSKETVIRILKNNNAAPPLTARVNTLKTTREELLKELEREGVRAVPVPSSDEAIELLSGANPAALPAHKRGLFYLQDVSSMLAARCLEPKPGHKVLDVCAGPGGKTAHIAALMENRGRLFALDVHGHRIALINENAKRLGITIIEARKQDATGNLAADYGGMDRVIADVPCSGLGVIRRRIDLKWRLRPQRIDSLTGLQANLLERAAECVGEGGILLYCTCTVTRRENADVVAAFLKRHPEFVPSPEWPPQLRRYAGSEGFVQILPGDENMDGFFIARLRRL